jgi:nucleoside phosphorylase
MSNPTLMVIPARLKAVLLAGALLLGVGAATPADAHLTCGTRFLIVTAMPLELNPLIERADITSQIRTGGHTYYLGHLAGRDVVLTMSGIGPANAAATVDTAFSSLACRFRAVLFSGVAGSTHNIGDVIVPRRWTLDEGKTWQPVDPALLKTARGLKASALGLTQDVPVGDAACACPGVDAATPVHLPTPVQLRVGGSGATTDPFDGRAVPCLPGGGDIAGCEPCLTAEGTADNAETFADRAPDAADLVAGLTGGQASSALPVDAFDEETAAVLRVARTEKVPFLGFRGVSDGAGDPLMLPGFPVQFVHYRQLAADNAAATVIAFLKASPAQSR